MGKIAKEIQYAFKKPQKTHKPLLFLTWYRTIFFIPGDKAFNTVSSLLRYFQHDTQFQFFWLVLELQQLEQSQKLLPVHPLLL